MNYGGNFGGCIQPQQYYTLQNYSNTYGNYQQPVAQPMIQPQPVQQSTLPGRIVGDISEIRPNETPTTGQVAIFPRNDGSAIYLTCMDQTGRIVTREYIPKDIPVQDAAPTVDLQELASKLSRIEEMLVSLTN